MSVYTVDRLGKTFPGRRGTPPCRALDDIRFTVQSGEILVVLGPNGAGKTTLLRILSGLETADSGDVRAGDQSLLRTPPHRRDIAMVFQNFSLYPRFTVSQNLEMPLRAPGVKLDDAEIAARVADVASMLGLFDKLNRKPGQLSGGEMQRVAIGRALVRRPSLILLDEPLTHLDAQLRGRMRTEIRQWQRTLGVSMIYVTHDHEEAMGMADRILALEEGRVLQVGAPEEVYRRPRNSRVARLLGRPPINLIPADTALEWGLPPGSGRWLGIRPESLRVRRSAGEGAVVKAVENMGATSVLVLEAAGQFLRAVVPPTLRMRLGEKVLLSVDPEDLRWFTD